MASSVSSRKRIRQNATHRSRNRWRIRSMRDAVKEYQEKLLHGSVDEAREALKKACAVVDKSAGQGVIHRNTASRAKSRMVARLKARQAG